MSLHPTVQQQAIMDMMQSGSQNTVGRARAGTGKTKTFEFGSKLVPEEITVTACCFNKPIQQTMERVFPKHWLVKTTHSLGLSSWMKRSHGRPKIEANKMKEIIRSLPGAEEFNDLMRAVGLCKAWGIVPNGALAEPVGMFPDEPATYADLFRAYNIDTGRAPDPVGLIRGALLRSIQAAWQHEVIDFDDMLYLPVVYKANFPRTGLVLIDEAQDIAPIQRGMLRLMLSDDSRLTAIGDDRQAIYGFRGAERLSLPKIIEEFNCEVLPLTVSFRCSQAVVHEAQTIVPDIEPWSGATIGHVVTVEDTLPVGSIPRGSAILCRNNAPIVGACLKFIQQGIGATILGRDIAKGLQVLIDKQKADSLSQLNTRLWDDVNHRAMLLEGRDCASQAANLKDRANCITHMIGYLGREASVWDLKKKLDSMFSDKAGVVTLSTIHKSKGMEWDDVFILDRELIPSKYCKSEEELQQEDNLLYVAITRSKNKLYYVDSEQLR